ncbi:hypothetical protein MKX01_041709 [Papaver californicum]|nr:hypothetical protein MKX01_041709 [Papaver californicum]
MGTTATKPRYSRSNIFDTSSKSINETVNGSHEYVIRGPGTDVKAVFGLKLLDQSGKGRHKADSLFESPLETGPFTSSCVAVHKAAPQTLRRPPRRSSN